MLEILTINSILVVAKALCNTSFCLVFDKTFLELVLNAREIVATEILGEISKSCGKASELKPNFYTLYTIRALSTRSFQLGLNWEDCRD
ncbi:MAG: hypothetical protein KatS3mg006_1161 [Pyrinomonadaceae bacterium]|nr:MAG: hypothetical protein KatS3mg006_1161 [Pyrinomonadaceae bacterium]